MKQINKLAILVITTVGLTACGVNPNGGNASSKTPDEDIEINVDSLKNGLRYLSYKKNYTLSYTGTSMVKHDLIFTKDAIGVSSDVNHNLDTFFIKDKGGIYSLTYDDDKYYASKYSEYTDLWNNQVSYVLYNVSRDYVENISDDVTSLVITDKTWKKTFTLMLGYTTKDYLFVDSITAKFDDKSSALSIDFKLNSVTYTYSIHDFGTSSIKAVNDYINNGGTAFTPNEEMNKAKELISGNNFRIESYSFGETSNSFVGYELFHPEYYLSAYYGGTSAQGYIELDCDASLEHDVLYGVYYYTLGYDAMQGGTYVNSISPNAYYSYLDVETCLHYPSKLSLLDNFQFAKEWDYEIIPYTEYLPGNGKNYVFTNKDVLKDFDSNFSITENFGTYGTITPMALGVDLYETDGDFNVYFVYKFKCADTVYYYHAPLSEFGEIDVPACKYILENFNRAHFKDGE